VLLPLALYIDLQGAVPGAGSEGPIQQARRFAVRAGGLVFLDIGDGHATEPLTTVEVRRPTPPEQRAAWEAALGPGAGAAPAHLAGQFVLTLADIREVATSAQDTVARSGGDLLAVLWRECLSRTRPALDSLAENLAPKARWKDIVLPETETKLLHQIAAQVSARAQVYDAWGFRERMNRGLGITALFAGESGTGKTMAAEVLANALELNLYRVDLSAVVSKYIGETEKNLRQVFDAAENGGAILFFDEADALFGKRSEVKDSHDRYANIEVNYLLQRMEAYRGLAILATNMKSALDPAFMRRLRFIVNFQYPAVAERREIWSRVFPEDTPTRGLAFDRLARLNLTGGNIHSVALNAAFLAAQAGEPVTMRLVLDAARTELRKLDRPINEADFRWPEPAGAAA
jgi:SpoVK/Ycf46/Vps4 family AAA+-type ATPase